MILNAHDIVSQTEARSNDQSTCPVCEVPAGFALAKLGHAYFACSLCQTVFTPCIDSSVIRTENNSPGLRHDPALDLERLKRMGTALKRPVKDLVDFGCGEGEFIQLMHQQNVRCDGIDKHTELQLDGLAADSLDGITMVEVIEHLYQPHEIFREFHRVLRPGGVVYVESSFTDGQKLESWPYLDPAIGHCTLHSECSMKLLAQKHGFALTKLNDNVFVMRKSAREVAFHFFPDDVLIEPSPRSAVSSLAATAQSLANRLAGIGPFYLHFGGAGDALLLLATFLDKNPGAQIVSFPNSIPAARSFFEAFPSLKRVWFLPKNDSAQIHILIRMLMRHIPNCQGMGVTPEMDYFKEWHDKLNIFKKFGVTRRPDWAKSFRTNLHPDQIALAPKGSLQGMLGSKRNIIDPAVWPQLLRFILGSGFRPVIIGTPGESKFYPTIEGCEDRRSHSFRDQMEIIANSVAFIGADSWAKTFSALAGVPTIVFEPLKGVDWIGKKDPSDFVFIDPWDEITVVKNLPECRAVFERITKKFLPAPKLSPKTVVAWEGSFLDHGSLSHVNRELTYELR